MYTICLSLLHYLGLMQFATFKIHTATLVRFCHCTPRSTLCRLLLTATKPDSSPPSALPTMSSLSETVGTGTRINAHPDFDDEQQRVRSIITMIVTLITLEKNDRFTNKCNIMYVLFHPQHTQNNILTKVLSDRNKLHFTIYATAT
jgi:hypothetical protein